MNVQADARPVIVVGHDGSERGTDALALGALLAGTMGANLVIAGVYRLEHLALPGSDVLEEDRRRLALEPLRAIDTGVLGVPATVRVDGARSPAHGLHELAEKAGAQLVVVGSTHRGRLGRVVPGSTGERLLQESPCAVAIAPLGYAHAPAPRLRVVGAGYEGTVESEAAVRVAAQIATQAGAALRIVMVVAPFMSAWGDPIPGAVYRETMAAERERAGNALEAVSHLLPESLPVECELREGPLAGELIRAAEGMDLLVMGSRAYGPFGRALVGSVSSAVARQIDCPAIVVPRAVGERSEGRRAARAAASPASPGMGVFY